MIREFTRCLTLAAPQKNDENPTSFIEIPFLFSAFFFSQRLFNSASVLLGHLWLFWLIFCVYYTAVKLSLHSLRGNQFSLLSLLCNPVRFCLRILSGKLFCRPLSSKSSRKLCAGSHRHYRAVFSPASWSDPFFPSAFF